ncbi:MAG: DedA family protein [Ignavibacteriae bacterium]|nr:DedA family protein [Ignavibacteriota bacterium]
MSILQQFIGIILHLDIHLASLAAEYGIWMYGILFLVIFCETGLVVTPFLPGDSLLFAAGSLCAISSINIFVLVPLLIAAAVLGDSTNYWFGRGFGIRIQNKELRFIKKKYLEQTEQFYLKHGAKTVILARFMPIIRTFAPFVAGLGSMNYRKFLSFSVIGSILWIGSFTFGGFFFGNIPFFKKNFTLVIVVIMIISLLPGIVGYLKARQAKNKIKN